MTVLSLNMINMIIIMCEFSSQSQDFHDRDEKDRTSQRGTIKFVDLAALAEIPRRYVSVATSPRR
jgi:hypothetical protein